VPEFDQYTATYTASAFQSVPQPQNNLLPLALIRVGGNQLQSTLLVAGLNPQDIEVGGEIWERVFC
jgi:hypothetical protein